jgi:predicted DNA-binding antitoxin AbrB/MazE fold protein
LEIGGDLMNLTIVATYENGVLIPDTALALEDNARVRVTIDTDLSWTERFCGILRWKGDPKELERLALSPVDDLEEEE